MAMARHHLQAHHGGGTFHQVIVNLAEVQPHRGRDGYRWDAEAWYGGDIDRMWLKSEGEGAFGAALEAADLLARAEGYYDQRITQRLILQPRVEFNLAAQDLPASRTGSGLVSSEFGLRLRYEIAREFAPYVGVSHFRKSGDTARFARAAGEDARETRIVIGIRTWF